MLVDDDELLLKVAGDELYRAGYAVQLCQHPTLTVPTAKTFQPQVLILDQNMPILSGREVLSSLRSFPELSQTLVVFLSSKSSPKDELRALIGGAVDVWRKPFTAEHIKRLRRLLDELLGQPFNPNEVERKRHRVLSYYLRERATLVMAVNPGTPFEGRAELRDGLVQSARLGPLTGADAIDEMLAIDDGVWRFENPGQTATHPASAVPTNTGPGYQPRVLLVDDDADLRKLCSLQLQRAGFAVTIAEDGDEGHRKAASADFDVVVADLNMPVLDGWGMLRLLKADPRMREPPVLFLSAHDDYRETLKAARAGAHDYLRKTGHADELVQRVKSLAQPRQSVYAALKAGQNIEGLELSWVGPVWTLRTIGELELSGVLEASDDWGTYKVKFSNGRVKEVIAKAGPRAATGVLGLVSLVVSRGAIATITLTAPTADDSGPLLLDQLVDACRRVGDFEAKVVADRLKNPGAFQIDEELYALYLRVGSERDVLLLRALWEEKIAPAGLSAHLSFPPEEVKASLTELMRRGVISLA